MITCKLCGEKFDESKSSCPSCGSRNEAKPEFTYESHTSDNTNNKTTDTSGLTLNTEPVKAVPEQKKKSNKKRITTIVAALLVVVAGSALVFAKPFSKKSAASNPDQYLKNILQKSSDEAIEALSESLSQKPDNQSSVKKENSAYDFDMDLALDSMLASMVSQSGFDLEKLSLSTEFTQNNDAFSVFARLNLNNETLLSAEALVDVLSSDVYVRVPELTSAYLFVQFEEMFETLNEFTTLNKPLEYYDIKDSYSYFSQNEWEQTLKTYYDISMDMIDNNVKFEKDVEVKIDGQIAQYDKFSVGISEKKAYDYMHTLFDTLNNDEILGMAINNFLSQYDISIDDFLDLFEEYDYSLRTKEILYINYFIDKKDNIKGIEIVIDDDYDNISMGYQSLENNGERLLNIWMSEDGDDILTITNKYTKKSNVINGETVFSVGTYNYYTDEYEVSELLLKYSDFVYDADNSIFKGSFSIIDVSDSLVSFSFDIDINDSNIYMDFSASYFGQDMFTLSISGKESDRKNTVNFDSSANIYDITDNDDAFDKYLNEIDLDAFLLDLYEKFDLFSLLY